MRTAFQVPSAALAALTLGLALTLAGCGTTVTQGALSSSDASSGLSLGLDGSTATTDTAVGGASQLSSLGEQSANSNAAVASTVADGSSSTSLPAASTKLSRPTVTVGITYAKPAGAGFAAIGAAGLTLGDQLAFANAVVADANAHRGLGGRKILPVFFGFDANPGAAPIPQQEQQACAFFTEDHHVEFVMGLGGANMIACLSKRGVTYVSEGSSTSSVASTFLRNPTHFELSGFNLDRRASTQVNALVREGYFAKWDAVNGGPGVTPVKVGILTYNTPEFSSSARGPLAKALADAGYKSPTVVEVSYHDSYDNLGAAQAQIQGAALRFKSTGVTHVIIWDDNGISTLFFLSNAESQGYRPRYGINSGNNMQLLVGKKLVNQRQAVGAIGIGWRAVEDVAEGANRTGKYSNAARRACDRIMTSRGADISQATAESAALGFCATMTAIKSRYDVTTIHTSGALAKAMDTLGSSYSSPITPATRIGPGRHDGLDAAYDYLYSAACTCMAYRGNPNPLAG